MQEGIRLSAGQALDPGRLEMIWKSLQSDLRQALGDSAFDLWLADCRLVNIEKCRATISTPGSMYAIWIEANFREVLKAHLDKYFEGLKGFSVVCSDVEPEAVPTSGAPLGMVQAETVIPAGQDGGSSELRPAAKERKTGKKGRNRRPLTPEELADKGRDAGLCHHYRFEHFIAGAHCAMAAAAARAVVDHPGGLYQPLFLHGRSGMGKTHLLHAIGWAFLEARHHADVRYVTAERFANEYIEAIRHSRETAFRKKYREADLLLIDDVQFLAGKSGFQTEFFHTFNSIADQRNQIVIASDCLASEIAQLEERLVSRMQWGMTAHIDAPDEETRTAILRQKREQLNLTLDDGIVSWIAGRVTQNVRQLEGALIRVSMLGLLGNGAVTEDQLEETLADLLPSQQGAGLGLEEIKQAVADHFDVPVKEIEGKRRNAQVSQARQVGFFLCRELTSHSLKDIAANFGKDHASVIYAVKAVKKKSEKSESLRNSLEILRRKLGRGGGNPRLSSVGAARETGVPSVLARRGEALSIDAGECRRTADPDHMGAKEASQHGERSEADRESELEAFLG